MPSKTNQILIDLEKIKNKINDIKQVYRKKINPFTHENKINLENTNNKLISYSNETSFCSMEDLLKLNYICFVFLNIIYLHYETNKVDFCILSIRNNPILEYAFQLSYNKFRAKFNTLQTISNDQGKNLALELNRLDKFFSILTHFFDLLPPPFSVVGGIVRFGISEANKKNKVFNSKKALKFCKTNENFTRIVSLLFSYILIKDLTDIENLDKLVEKNFSVFWKILNKQAKQALEKSSFPLDIEKFWAYCFGLLATLFYNPKNSFNINIYPFYGTKFFEKKFQPFPTQVLENKTAHARNEQPIEINNRVFFRG